MKQGPEPPRSSVGRVITPSGIPLKVTYPAAAPRDLPGEFPFTRGIHANMYRGKLWTFRQYAGFGNVEETNRRFRYLLEQGQTGLSVAFDLPTQIGYDSDDPLARGEVGKVGVPISTLADMDALLEGIPLEDVSISMTINSTAAMLVAFLVGVARKRGVPLEKLRGTVQNDMLKEFISRRTYRFPLAPSLRLVTDIFEYCERELPRWNPISVSGYHMREAGSTATQEVAFTLANAIAYLEAGRDRGIPLETLTRRISFFWNAHNHLLEEVAKFRAARRLWAQIVRERFGLVDPACGRMRFHVQTAGSTLTSQEPENNAVRVTIQALAAVLGGTQSLHTNGIDEALGLPSQASARTALRTQQVLAFESGIADVADPLGGAPAIEALTTAVEDEVRKILERIDAMGGTLRAVEEGFPQRAIEEEAYRQQQEIESGERKIVGVNCFRDESNGSIGAAAEGVDVALEPKRIETLQNFKAARPKARIASLCARLRTDAEANKNILPALIACGEGGVTIGEMTTTLAEIYGEYHE
jgi:methylmalonyl-CoA mutase N-terminal domain/subunit